MADDESTRAELLGRIASRRASVLTYLTEQQPRFRRRANVTIVLTTLAAISTAGPAVGGESFAGGVQRALGLPSDSSVWRVLCFVALVVSVGAAVLTNLDKSRNNAAQLATVEATAGELEGLGVLLEFGDLSVQDAVKLFHQYTSKVAFVPGGPVPGRLPDAPEPIPAEVARRAARVPPVPPPSRQRPSSGARAGGHPYPGPPPPH
jgi:hypothetical protein